MLYKRIIFPLINILLLKSRMVLWSGALDEEQAKRICNSIARLNARSKETIFLQFYSGGGYGDPMRSVMDAVRSSEAPITGIADIACMSAAFFVLQCCKTRMARPKTEFMFHGGSLGTLRIGQSDLKERLEEYEREYETILTGLAERSGKVSLEQVRKMAQDEKVFGPEEAIEWGFIDEIYKK